ncbi:hypothetical protein C8Q78DRAFT_1059535 [Trametes maxima]|nr:hypothetical protein C8Q78DRAFT_1059535 [Trametes maxima]
MSTSRASASHAGPAPAPVQQQGTPSASSSHSSPPPVKDAITYYHVPFPPGTDPVFSVAVTIQGVLGMPMCPQNISGKSRLNTWIAKTVDGMVVNWDKEFPPGEYLCTQRAYFASEPTPKTAPRETRKEPDVGFTWGHLLTLLAQKQYRHWRDVTRTSADGKSVDFVDIVGGSHGIARGTLRVSEENLHIIAVRRFQTKHGKWCYFPEIEVRV